MARYARGKGGCGMAKADMSIRDRRSFIVDAFYLLALFFFACGLMSKPMVVTLPCVLLLLDFWPLQRFNASALQLWQGTKGHKRHFND